MSSSPTKSGARKLSEVARKVAVPDGIVATGWPAVEATCRDRLGVEFDDWQKGAGRLILSKRADGKLACMIGGVGMSLPRQVGKTYLIGGMVFALCVNTPGLLVIWSAHHARTHGETFLSMQAFADRSKVKPYVAQVFKGSGDEEIRFHNGSRILFGARERGFGRGIPGVDVIMSDEAQIMSDKALDAQLATMNTSQFGLALYVGTPPRPDDPSEAFTRMRTEAWSGELRDAAWIEFGAETGADPKDRAVWRLANPSYPHRTPAESILRLQRKLKGDSFLREGLGVWDEESDTGLTVARWDALADPDAAPSGALVLGWDVSPGHGSGSVTAVGSTVLELVERRTGSVWLPARLDELVERHAPTAIAYDPDGPGATLLPKFSQRVTDLLEPVGGKDAVRAVEAVGTAARERVFRHRGEVEFHNAVAGHKLRRVGDGNKLSRRDSTVDISPLVAATVALWVAGIAEPDYDVLASAY